MVACWIRTNPLRGISTTFPEPLAILTTTLYYHTSYPFAIDRKYRSIFFNYIGGIILRGLGERLNGIQEVSGSIPLISTPPTVRSAFFFVLGP